MESDEPCVCGTPFTCVADHLVSAWCVECDAPADVIDEGIEQQDWIDYARTFWVRRLDCGHEDVTER